MANYRFICAFILSGCMFSQHAMSQEKVNSECASKYGIAIDGCTTKSGYTELFLERYNIHSVDVKSSYDKALDSNRSEIRDLVKRYKQTYNQLNSVDDKLSFVNLFLSRVTDKYNLTLKLGNGYDESIKVIVNGSRGYNDLPVGYVISLFGNDIISDETYNLYFRYLSMLNSNSFTQKIAEDVTYVLNGYTNSINEVAFKKMTILFRNDVKDEDDDDDSSEDDEYIQWAEEQALGWGDGYDYWWDGNDAGEEFITFKNLDTGEETDAYHFTPSGD